MTPVHPELKQSVHRHKREFGNAPVHPVLAVIGCEFILHPYMREHILAPVHLS